MKLQRKSVLAFIILLLQILGFSPLAQANLVDLGDGRIWDQDRGIDWVKNANLAQSNSFGVGGIDQTRGGEMDWVTARNYIFAMNINSYLGYSDWRLPSALNSDGNTLCLGNFKCNDSEPGHLYYNELVDQTQNVNTGFFERQSKTDANGTAVSNIFSNFFGDQYWTDTTSGTDGIAFNFALNDGIGGGAQDNIGPGTTFIHVWAVRDHVSPVPLPAAAWLFGSSLLGLLGFSRKHRYSA